MDQQSAKDAQERRIQSEEAFCAVSKDDDQSE
jgi:hypothetical protein